MEDITSYGEISSAHHKGEMTSLGFVAGCCLALAGLFFGLSGLYHIVVSLYPYWERVTLGDLAEIKGITNFAYFSIIASARMFFGAFLVFLAMQMWDGKAGCRRLLILIVIPATLFIGSYLPEVSEFVSNSVFTLSGISSSPATAGFLISLILILIAIILSVVLGERLRGSSTDTTWLRAVGYCVVMVIGFFFAFGELDVEEQNTALLDNLPPFSLPDSGFKMIVLDSVSFEYVECITVIGELNEACEKQNRIKKIMFNNFTSIPRSARLVEIMETSGSLSKKPVCQESGKYLVDLNGKWSCSIHGSYNEDRLERGKRLQALLNGQDVSGDDSNYDDDDTYDDDNDGDM